MATDNDNDVAFRELAQELALDITSARWACNGTQYKDEHLDGLERIGIPKEKAVATVAIGVAIQFIECRRLNTLFIEDLEIAGRKVRKGAAMEAHAYLERLARARYRVSQEAGDQVLSMMQDFNVLADRIVDEEAKQTKRAE